MREVRHIRVRPIPARVSRKSATIPELPEAHDLELAVRRPRPPQHPLRLGDGRRDLPHRPDAAGTVGAPGVFIVPLQKEFGWTTAEISSALSIRFVLFGLMAPFAAALMNRYGLRNVDAAGAAHRRLRPGRVAGDDGGLAVDAAVGRRDRARHRHDRAGAGATIAARWFVARRGLVVGILTASVATGQLVFLPLLASLTEHYGWRIALSLVCVMLGVSAFAVLMVMRDRPSDVGLRPFGDEGTEPLPAPPPNTAPIMAAALGTLRDASKSSVFWILFATFFICGASTNGLVQVHLIPMCLDFGIPQVQAAGLLAAMGIFDFVGTIAVRLAVGPLRQSQAAVLVLRPARPVAAVPAVLRFHALRPVAVRGVLRPRLDRDRAADGAAHRAALRARARQPRVRLDLRRPSAGRRRRGLRRRLVAHGACRAYLPAFFVAGALCIVAALIVLAISAAEAGGGVTA